MKGSRWNTTLQLFLFAVLGNVRKVGVPYFGGAYVKGATI